MRARMVSRLTESAGGALGVLLMVLVALGSVSLSPALTSGLERLPWFVDLYSANGAFRAADRAIAEPLPLETAGVTTEELRQLGAPVDGPAFERIERDTVFPRGIATFEAAGEQVVLSARRALWSAEREAPGLAVEVVIIELPNNKWAALLADYHRADTAGGAGYPELATTSHQLPNSDNERIELATVVFREGPRLLVRVRVGVGPLYRAAIERGERPTLNAQELARDTATLASANLPDLVELEGWNGLDATQLRMHEGATAALAASLMLLARAIGITALDRGSREVAAGFRSPVSVSRPDDVVVSSAARRRRRLLTARTVLGAIAVGPATVILYGFNGDHDVTTALQPVALAAFILALVSSMARCPRTAPRLGLGWRTAEAFAAGASAAVLMVGVYLVAISAMGLAMVSGQLRLVFLLMMAAGVTVAGQTAAPARLFRRLSMPAIKRRLSEDERAPVLFLRSFQDDDLVVRIRNRVRASIAERLSLLDDSTFEDLIAWRAATLGPVVAIGQPGTRLQPLGAVRDYFTDDEWQPAVRERISGASAVVFLVGRSPGAQWELGQLIANAALAKTLFVFPPVPAVELDKRCTVLATGLRLEPVELSSGLAPHTRLLAIRFGPEGELVRYVADGRDDVAYGLAVDEGLAAIEARPTSMRPFRPVSARREGLPIATSLLVSYDPSSRRRASSDPFRRVASDLFDLVAH